MLPVGLNHEKWSRVQSRLRSELGASIYNTWLSHLVLDNNSEHNPENNNPTEAVFSVANESLANFIETQYSNRLLALCQNEVSSIRSVRIDVVVPAQVPVQHPVKPPLQTSGQVVSGSTPNALYGSSAGGESYRTATVQNPVLQPTADNNHHALHIGMTIDRRFTFDTFVAGSCNQMAFGASQQVVSDDSVIFNPLYIFGGIGMGKTHLLHAIASGLQAKDPNMNVMLLSAERFTTEFVRAIRSNNSVAFKDMFAHVDVLLVDDIQFIAGKKSTTDEFMSTIATLASMGKQVVLCASKSPFDLEGLDEREKSRLAAGLVVEIKPADYEMRRSILQQKATMVGAHIPNGVIDYLSENITSSIRELEGALNRLIAYANLVKVPVTQDLVEDVLHDLLRNSNRQVTLDDIKMACAKYFDLSMEDLKSKRRSRNIARPRQVAMYLAKTMTSHSLPQIGRAIGGRDHTTVMHAVGTIEKLCETDSKLENDIRQVKQSLLG